ncbi:hypothetical protein CSPAE12_09852 [Colletotrichum incanum]|nr:hypothetical protein CSPAE12_09852 [Colletotrichum incanum]
MSSSAYPESLEECSLDESRPLKEDVDSDTEVGQELQNHKPLRHQSWRRRLESINCLRPLLLTLVILLVSLVAVNEILHPRCPDVRRPMDFSGWICAPNGAIPEVAQRFEDEYNLALLREFENDGPWHRYVDKEGKIEIPQDNKVLKAAWLTRREHIIHCKYALRQTHLWIMKGWDPSFNYSHTLRCTGYLVDTIMLVQVSPLKDEMLILGSRRIRLLTCTISTLTYHRGLLTNLWWVIHT